MFFILKHYIKKILRYFFNAINGFEKCIICSKKTYYYPLCRKCINQLFFAQFEMEHKRCRICGKELVSFQEVCLECREKRILNSVDYIIPLFSYRLWNKELMFIWKSSEIRSLSELFSKIAARAVKKTGEKIIVPVPPRKGKIKEKGWDQIEELCNYLQYFYGFTILRLLKRENKKQQKKLNREERLETIGKNYFLKEKGAVLKELKKTGGKMPASVCLLDDVCTTGATVEGCAERLKEAGIEKVSVVTLFMVD